MTSKITISPKFNLMDIFRMPISKRNNNYHLYKSGRYSLYYALGNIKKIFKEIDTIYVPNLICPQVLIPIKENGIAIKYYNIDRNLNFDKKILLDEVDDKCIVLVINYFGFPSDWEFFNNLKKNKKCLLISDNCHAIFTEFKKKSLNEYGDISFNSLRKIIPTLSGSQLFYNNNNLNIMEKNINPRLPNKDELKLIFRSLKPDFIKKNYGTIEQVGEFDYSKNYSKFFNIKKNTNIDIFSNNIFEKYLSNEITIKKKRIENFNYWSNFLPSSDFHFINIDKMSSEICPYVFPCVPKSTEIMNKWLSWSKMKNIVVINWGNKHEFLDKDLKRILLFPVAHNFDIAKSLVR